LVLKALSGGPESLSPEEKTILLKDPDCVARLHLLVWELPGGEAARKWGINPP
jgi:membrane glycosyltransferase